MPDSLPKIADDPLMTRIAQQFFLATHGKKRRPPQLIAFAGGPEAGKSFLYYENNGGR